MINYLGSRYGRLAAFFLLYLTEGLPQGFALTAITTHMKRQGVSTDGILTYSGWITFPWALKFIVAPFVDLLYSNRLGRRRGWILICQLLMVASLLAAMRVDFVRHLHWFMALLILHNVFAATQDVAIDALAVETLAEHERGLANGLMFAGAYLGSTMGGAGALLVIDATGINGGLLYVCVSFLLITFLVTCWLREAPVARRVAGSFDAALRQVREFIVLAGRGFVSSRGALVGVVFALLPAGAMALGGALSQTLGVDLGLTDNQLGNLGIVTGIFAAGGCVIGGFLSDRFGRRKSIAAFIASTAIPCLALAWVLQQHGFIMPREKTEAGIAASQPATAPASQPATAPATRPVARDLFVAFWVCSCGFSFCNGLMYGTRTALFMDVVEKRVAATHFTAYMALLNLVITYTPLWQGQIVKRWGYPITLAVDAAFGLLCLALLPLMQKRTAGSAACN